MKRVVFGAAGVTCVAIALAVGAGRPWSIQAQFPGAVLLFLGVLSLACVRAGSDARATMTVTAVSVLVALYGAEAFFSFSPPKPVETRVITYGASHDQRTKEEVVLDLRRRGDSSAVPMVYPSFSFNFPEVFPDELRAKIGHEIQPLGGISGRTTVLCNESGKWSVYKADEHGFRNPPGMWSAPLEIAVVGDSFSNGNCVSDGEDWVDRIRARYARTLNLGVGGNGPLSMLATIREYLADLKPRTVIWQYFEAHDTRIPPESTVPLLNRYLADPAFRQGLAGRQVEIDALLDRVVDSALGEPELRPRKPRIRLSEFIRFSQIRARLAVARSASSPAPAAATADVLRPVLEQAARTVHGWGGKIYFLYLPSWRGVQGGEAPQHYAPREQVLKAAEAAGMKVIDAFPAFAAQRDPLSLFPYRSNYHYNASGCALVADIALKNLSPESSARGQEAR